MMYNDMVRIEKITNSCCMGEQGGIRFGLAQPILRQPILLNTPYNDPISHGIFTVAPTV